MPVNAPEDVEDLLRSGSELGLIGEAEDDWLDFKEQPYVLAQAKHRWELAKDVANMASNPGGGCIVLGVGTKQDADDFEELADQIKPFPCNLVDDQQYRDTIDAFAYPPIRGLKIRQYRRADGCLALISIPPQAEDDRPFLLKRVVDADGGVVDAFAVPTRDGSHTRWTPIGQVHRDLADGRRSRQAGSAPEAVAAEPARVEPLEPRLLAQVEDIERYMDWSDAAVYALAAMPVSAPDRIPDLYGGELFDAFSRPPQLRHAGFGIGWSQEPRIENGSLVASDADFRVRQLDTDGFFLVAAKAEEDFLGRVGPRPTGEPRALRINTTVLVEFTYEFCRFQASVLQTAIPGDWRLGLLVRGGVSRPWRFALGPRGAHFDHEYKVASSDSWEREIAASGDAEADTFELLARFYDLFGLAEALIPFADDRRITPDALRDLSG